MTRPLFSVTQFGMIITTAALGMAWAVFVRSSAPVSAQTPQATPRSSTPQVADAGSQPSETISTGFEQFRPGPVVKRTGRSGIWEASGKGHATIHTEHQRTGKQSLRLLGGDQRRVTWTLPAAHSAADSLDLWFERWTSRQPFDFRIESLVGETWHTLHHDTRRAVVGSFQNRLSLPLPGAPTKIRFTSTTPSKTGVMIDDVVLTTAGPMQIHAVSAEQQVAPVLIRNEVNPILDIQVEVSGSQQPLFVSELQLRLRGTTDPEDIEFVEVFATGDSTPEWRTVESKTNSLQRFGRASKPKIQMRFNDRVALVRGTNHFFVSVKLKRSAKLSNRIGVVCDAIMADQPRKPTYRIAPTPQRIGYAVRKVDDDDARVYRIPGLVTTNAGTLIGVYDVRYCGWGDLPNDIDVGISRSTDGGQTWETMQIIMDMGNDPKWRYDGIGDPSILVDRARGTIWVAATWSHGNRSWHGSGPGLEPDETGQLMLVRSDDDGVTWSSPINITRQVKRPEWSFILQGPGRGISMRDGTLVLPAQYQDPPEQKRTPHSTIIYSKDHGETWHCGSGAFSNTTESAVAEIEPGVLMLNCRYDLQNRRVVMITRDLGNTWQEHPTSRKSLPEPRACMGSLLGPVAQDGRRLLFFSNPNAERPPRRRMSIKASDDLGTTWPKHWHTLLDEGASAGYSCLTRVDNDHLGILFEGSRADMTFLRIPISELTKPSINARSSSPQPRTHFNTQHASKTLGSDLFSSFQRPPKTKN